ncbi:hypothetical protein HMPREF9446_01910 [Bacteroides fluxus YIT 12057]|uniref:Uncharacterized protein n=1 Tax=Bacteroides fluxus YIT 12057 TaxID=763034 RepID=F3PT44_9BACE|nr:hypothetical protein HMPREF9446_01910 [Bacteroides fluxus YIT 12057]
METLFPHQNPIITDKYHFPDQSFSRQYFKKHTEMSHKEYRAKRGQTKGIQN